jgi:dihydroorotate dehydrogenase (fumarate)
MTDLSVQYLGKKLSSPIIVSSSSLTRSVEGVKKCADAGAGAVVLKSLFEEQIEAELNREEAPESGLAHPEAEDYFRQMGKHLGPSEYLRILENAKKSVKIPVFASLNCVTDSWWTSYAKQLAATGADGLEINLSRLPRNLTETSEEAETRLVRIIEKVTSEVAIPVAAKIGPYFTTLPRLAVRLNKAGASALVLFNRFYQLDIDPEKMELSPGYQFSSPAEMYTSLRWISILSGQVECDLSASTGVHDGSSAIKQLLAGATSVQVCSVLYQKGMGEIRKILDGITAWMREKRYASIGEFKGKLSQSSSEEPESYERLQYVKALTGIH